MDRRDIVFAIIFNKGDRPDFSNYRCLPKESNHQGPPQPSPLWDEELFCEPQLDFTHLEGTMDMIFNSK